VTTLLLPDEAFARREATVADESYHHLFRVRRLQVGDRLRVVDGRGAAREARVESVGKREARLALAGPAAALEPELEVELHVAAPKPERAAWLVEKATELGVVAIRFVATDREARSFGESQLARLRRVAISALEQCGRARLPEVCDGGDVRAAAARARGSGAAVVLLHAGGARVLPPVAEGARSALFVGPEGGWSAEELAALREHSTCCWSLGPTVLRVETAAIAGAAALLAR
jgi:16S rRNA (uracil1498-N3)-methyltransferase